MVDLDHSTWRKLITIEMERWGENWSDVEAITLSAHELDIAFDNGYGHTEGIPFTLWTVRRVYFPVVYDGAEWCESVSRRPDGQPTDHVGNS